MVEYVFISYVAMLIKFIYTVNNGGHLQPSSINIKLGVFISFFIVVGFAPITFIIFMIKRIGR